MYKKVIKASAGTGKTYRLSLEYISLILKNKNFEEILVITFTRKATAEIRERIFEHMSKLLNSFENEGREIFDNIKKIYPDIIYNKDLIFNNYKKMLGNKDKVKIYTIDSFTNTIFRRAIAPLLNIFSYEMIEDDKNEDYFLQVLEKIISNSKHFSYFEEFFKAYLERDVTKYSKIIEFIIKNRWKFLMLEQKERKKRSVNDFVNIFQECIELIKKGINIKKEENDKKKSKKTFNENINNWVKKDFYKYFESENKEKFLVENYKAIIGSHIYNGAKFKGKTVNHLVEEISLLEEDVRKGLANYIYNTKLIDFEEHIFNLSKIIFKEYDDIKIKDRKFSHSDISIYTYKYLYEGNFIKDGFATKYFYDILGEDIKHFLVDEFQDTSTIQWNVFLPLIKNAETFIAVGDSKQSIYGWRGGQKELFDTLEDILDADKESLDTSYRSERELVEFVNKFFSSLGEWNYENVNYLKSHNKGFVKTITYDKESYVNFSSDIAQEIKDNIKDYSKLCILARSNSSLNKISEQLEKEGIPCIIENNLSIIEHRSIKPLFFLMKFLIQKDFFELLNFLRSDIIFMKNKDLKDLIKLKSELMSYIFYYQEEKEDFVNLSKSFSKYPVLNKIREFSSLNFKDFIKKYIEDFSINEIFILDNDRKNIIKILELSSRFFNLKDFLMFLKENKDSSSLKQEGIEEINAVRLMTIHKSKGLEFETEFYYWELGKRGRPDSSIKFYSKFSKDYSCIEDYIIINPKYISLLEYLDLDFSLEEKRKQAEEELNNLYVAFTRAKKNLCLFIKLNKSFGKITKKDNPYQFYLNALVNAYNNPEYLESFEDFKDGDVYNGFLESSETFIQTKKENLDFENLKKYFFEKEYTFNHIKKEEKYIENENQLNVINKQKKGLAIHYYLSFIKYNEEDERILARNLSFVKYGNMIGREDLELYIKQANKFLDNNKKFYEKIWKVFNEFAIFDKLNEGDKLREYRLDRLMIDEKNKKILILDYKTGFTKDNKQLEEYKELVKRKTNNKYKIDIKFLEIK